MTDTSTEAVKWLADWHENDGDGKKYFDQAKALAAERDKWHAGWMEAEAKVLELEAERVVLKAELHEARMQSIVDFGKLQKACEEVERLAMALKEAEEEMASGCDATAYRVIRAALQENTDG